MDRDTILEVIKTLIGNTTPVGDSCIDDEVLKNINTLAWVADSLMNEIIHIHNLTENDSRYSVILCRDETNRFIKNIVEYVDENRELINKEINE